MPHSPCHDVTPLPGYEDLAQCVTFEDFLSIVNNAADEKEATWNAAF
jgi:hypothetical protein